MAPPRGERAWDRPALARLQAAYREYGLELAVIEDTAPMDAGRLGTAGRDEHITGLRDATYGRPPGRYGRQVGEDALR